MKPRDLALAMVIAAVWGFNFVAIKLGVATTPPFLLTALRFFLAAIPAVFFVGKPRESMKWVATFGLVLGVGQFGFLFLAVRLGLPAGLTSIVMQLQAFFTMAFAWALLGEKPLPRQIWGGIVAFSGIGVIGYSRWAGPDALPLFLCIIAAAGWAGANIISKAAKPESTLSFVVWSCLFVPLPMIALSIIFEDHTQALSALAHPSVAVVVSLLYLAYLATVFAYAAWNYLFNHYSTSTVAPFSLLVPLFGVLGGVVAFGESFDRFELIGAALIVGGLLISNFAKLGRSPTKENGGAR